MKQRKRARLRLQAVMLAIAVGMASAVPATVAAQHEPARVEQPRPFGHVIGDVLRQRVRLDGPDRGFEPARLPAQRRGMWFERLPLRIETSGEQRWLVVEHQIINAPTQPVQVVLPATSVPGTAGAGIAVPAFTVGIGPLVTGVDGQGATPGAQVLERLRAERTPPDTAAARARTAALRWGAASALCALAWLAWLAWRNRRDAARLPFAHADAQARRGGGTADGDTAWQALHHAFDRTAGHVVHAGNLDALHARAPWLAPMRADIAAFFARSSQRFFGSIGPPSPDDRPARPAGADAAVDVPALARALRALERRQRR